MPQVASVFLLAENRLLREALIRLLSKQNIVRVIGAASYSTTIHHQIIAARPSIIVLDSSGMAPCKTAFLHMVRSAIRSLRIVMVDMTADEHVLLDAIRAGIVGYVLKDASASEIVATICAVAAGKAVCPPSLCMALFRRISAQESLAESLHGGITSGLTRREQQIAELLCKRLTNKEIASCLNLSEQTVKNHVHRTLRKVGAPNRFRVSEACQTKRVTIGLPYTFPNASSAHIPR